MKFFSRVQWDCGVLTLLFLQILSLSQCSKDNHVVVHSAALLPDCSPNILFGYTDKTSYYPDEIIKVFLQSSATKSLCGLNIYTIENQVAFRVSASISPQVPAFNPSINGYKFQNAIEINVPQSLVSGVYLIEKTIPFILKTRDPVDLIVVYPSNTANAYCASGGVSLYTSVVPPTEVSFLRPIPIQADSRFCLKWFSSQNIKVGFVADSDLDSYNSISQAKIIAVVGHSEYWTRKARLNFDQFINSGGHALLLSGNSMWWQVRYTEDGKGLICYRHFNIDPISDPLLKTINWNDPLLQYSILRRIGADFSYGGYGLKNDHGWDGFKITSPQSPLLQGLNLKRGDILHLPSRELDGAPILFFDSNGFPVINTGLLNVNKVELIGYDLGTRFGKQTIGTFIVVQRTQSSGIIVNTATTDWCGENGMGGASSEKIKLITSNAIDILLNNKNIFSK